ncbi:hypothetical protein [Aurantimonas marina]|uniref:hypothetical protein n=1 Tax=Aurantimonas marina TaxID=2780508 RepID=UPI0019D0A4F6|nr:hypothetical protein [Aurantimonas marina]
MGEQAANSGSDEAIVIIKAAPQVGKRHGETVCCAGLDLYGRWLRLYPVSFRHLEERQKFGRWDRIRFKWRRPPDDSRTESRRVDQQSLEVVGKLRHSERGKFLANAIVHSLAKEREEGRSLALLKPEVLEFRADKKTETELAKEQSRFDVIRSQSDMFAKEVTPYHPCPYFFRYRYRTQDGLREGTCQDWEVEATFFKWSREYGEKKALAEICRVFGEEYPERGMLLAMGTHSLYPDVWLVNGVIRLDQIQQGSLF